MQGLVLRTIVLAKVRISAILDRFFLPKELPILGFHLTSYISVGINFKQYLKPEQECYISIYKLKALPRALDTDKAQSANTLNGLGLNC